ncbi:hypothetical protein GE061_009660 [Apolygus lucorum]|uniref:Uncharacterized protein n=1 Tax=Apolygus lucorum TaxID=248454 RepID=A0A8S9Y4Y8_APOLU|nr:hypothetical protein GE061_009660 [Apolygus lucorum]
MNVDDFRKWEDGSSKYKLKKMDNRPYLAELVRLKAERSKYFRYFAKQHNTSDFEELHFLKKSMEKGIQLPETNTTARGVPPEKKADIIAKLGRLIPPNRLPFWENLPTDKNSADLITTQEN